MSDDGTIDGALLERWHGGDGDAAGLLVHRHQASVLGFLVSMGVDRALAEDLLQETLLRALSRLDRYHEQGRFRALLFRIARNLWADHHRSRRGGTTDAALEAMPAPEDLERDAIEGERTERLHRALAALPDAQREVVLLHYYSGLSFREIAEIQDCPLGTCLGRMHYALRHLRKLVPQEEWTHGL
jgi:RNA polymerase sigma-70 factor (ECF subfamily)